MSITLFAPATIPQSLTEMTEEQKCWIIDTYGLSALDNWHDPEFKAFILNFIFKAEMHTPELVAQQEERAQAFDNERKKQERLAKAQKIIDSQIPYLLTEQHQPFNAEYWPAGTVTADRYIHDIKQGATSDLIIHGRTRTGKSRLAAYILEELVLQGYNCYWLNCVMLRDDLIAGMHDKQVNKSVMQRIERAKNSPVLVLDDIGKAVEQTGDNISSGFFASKFYTIFEHRSTTPHCATITTSELAPNSPEMRDRLTDAVVARMLQRAEILTQQSKATYTLWKQHNEQKTAQETKGFLGQNQSTQQPTAQQQFNQSGVYV